MITLDISEWERFDLDLLNYVEKEMPVQCKRFMKREGTKLARQSRNLAKNTVNKKTGNYFKSIKASRAWQNSKGGYGVKAYSSAPHAHLLESGHDIYIHGTPIGKKTTAFKIMDTANRNFDLTFQNDVKAFIYESVDKGLKER